MVKQFNGFSMYFTLSSFIDKLQLGLSKSLVMVFILQQRFTKTRNKPYSHKDRISYF